MRELAGDYLRAYIEQVGLYVEEAKDDALRAPPRYRAGPILDVLRSRAIGDPDRAARTPDRDR